LDIQCPSCQQLLAIDNSMAGQAVACPHCGQAMQIPAATPVTPLPTAGPGPGRATRVTPLPQNPFPIATDRPGRRPSSSRRSTRRSRHKEKGDDSTKQLLGIFGSLILFAGVFCPFFRIFDEPMDYFHGVDGVVVLSLAVISFICVLSRAFQALWFTGIGAMGILLFSVINYQMMVSGKPLLSATLSLDWGCPLLIVGAALVIAAAAKSMTPRQ
jgi:hypothetical protein